MALWAYPDPTLHFCKHWADWVSVTRTSKGEKTQTPSPRAVIDSIEPGHQWEDWATITTTKQDDGVVVMVVSIPIVGTVAEVAAIDHLLCIYSAANPLFCSLLSLSHLNHTVKLWESYYYYSHYKDERTEFNHRKAILWQLFIRGLERGKVRFDEWPSLEKFLSR